MFDFHLIPLDRITNEKHLPSDLFHVTPEQVTYWKYKLYWVKTNTSTINIIVVIDNSK